MGGIILLQQGLGDIFERSYLNVTTVLHFQPCLAFIKIEDTIRSQGLTGAIHEADHFIWIFSDGSHIGIPLEIMCEFGTRQGASSIGTSVHRE